MTAAGVPCVLMRGGTSKGLYLLAEDLPDAAPARDDLLMRLLGTPDARQIDGLGGATPLTSKVAVVSRSAQPGADIDYLFLQVGVDEAVVSDRQNCGNLLAGVGQFAVERGLVPAGDPETEVRIRMVNSGSVALTRFPTPAGVVQYAGDTAIAGVPGTAAPVVLEFADTVGSATGRLLPTGSVQDVIDGTPVTCVDNGMPVVVASAESFGLSGHEPHSELAANQQLLARIDRLRIQAGALMGLGDVTTQSVPKTTLVAEPRDGGMLATRTFIPVRPHTAIGVLGAISAATAVRLPGAVGHDLTTSWPADGVRVDIEHPTGHLVIEVDVDPAAEPPTVRRSGVVRTARKLFDGMAFPRG
ncbi:4-oxalomesaconate tautomerase [Streptomyces sp. NPDC008343]|uniref:4-oxalomesaconate tautomerase n=1 Tax=Streptomyces sp. NPDC008343 TaxID=3364828 RepID=UPI0036E2D023